MQEIKFDAVDYKNVLGIGKSPRNKTFISSLVVKVNEREKTEGSKKTIKCVSKARKTDNPEKKSNMNVNIFFFKSLKLT